VLLSIITALWDLSFFPGGGNCSVSRWRPQKVDKRMYLDYTQGLFITLTEFRLSTTFIRVIIIMHTTGIIHHLDHSNMYTNTSYNIHYM
jgi:hypothetical protein